MTEVAWLEGKISIEAALKGQYREFECIYIQTDKKNPHLTSLLNLAQSQNVPITYKAEGFFLENAQGKTHGGILATVGPRKFLELQDLIEGIDNPFVFMLDGVEDPFNFGQAVRALYAAGASGLVVRRRNWLSASDIVARSSAGASELMPIAVADSALDAAGYFRKKQLLIACTAHRSAVSIFEANLDQPLFILVGGEKRGITRSFLDQADLLLQIPYGHHFTHSLGVATSTAIVAFEIMRRRIST